MEKKETSASEVSQMEDGEEWVDVEREGGTEVRLCWQTCISFVQC